MCHAVQLVWHFRSRETVYNFYVNISGGPDISTIPLLQYFFSCFQATSIIVTREIYKKQQQVITHK